MLLSERRDQQTAIADILGYANHNAVSKRLAQIRRAAQAYFDET